LALAKPRSMSSGRVDGMREEKVGPHRSGDPWIGKVKPPSVSRGWIGRAEKHVEQVYKIN
jgi:hypothetical protein